MPKEYIEREAVLEKTEIFDEYIEGQDVYFEFIDVKDVKSIPAADVVEVVRCKDCKHWFQGDCCMLRLPLPDDYCSYGEKKDGVN